MLSKTINGIKYWGQLCLLPIYWLSFLFPRSRYIWLFGSTFGRRFVDNPRYFYLYCSQHSDEILIRGKRVRPIWISHDKCIVEYLVDNGYEAYYYHSLKGIWYSLRGKVYIFDNYSKDISFWLSGGAKKINLWHGVGNKCINYDNQHDRFRHPKNAWERFKCFPRRLSDEKPGHYILTTSPMMTEIFERAFQCRTGNAIEVGYPRNDFLLQNKENPVIKNLYMREENVLREKIAEWKQQGKALVGYLPTFRDSESKFTEVINLETFDGYLEEHGLILICKLHPKSKCRKVFENIRYANIYNVGADVDVNSFLGDIDLLIADYSSVYSDYMLVDKPVVAFHYDYKEYSGDTRDAYFDFDEYMPEIKAMNMAELETAILQVMQLDECREKRGHFCRKIFTYKDAGASRRLVERICGLL